MLDFRASRVLDHSALEAINALAERYGALDKRVHLRGLSSDCYGLLARLNGDDKPCKCPLISESLLDAARFQSNHSARLCTGLSQMSSWSPTPPLIPCTRWPTTTRAQASRCRRQRFRTRLPKTFTERPRPVGLDYHMPEGSVFAFHEVERVEHWSSLSRSPGSAAGGHLSHCLRPNHNLLQRGRLASSPPASRDSVTTSAPT